MGLFWAYMLLIFIAQIPVRNTQIAEILKEDLASFTESSAFTEVTNDSDITDFWTESISAVNETTQATSVVTTTTVKASSKPPSTTSAPSTTQTPLFEPASNEDCNCDLLINYCDINCCCDQDCSSEDKTIFSECYHRPNPFERPELCFSQQFLYKNNTKFKVIVEQDGLMCISRDNYPDRLKYIEQPVVTTSSRFAKVMKRRPVYSWKVPTPKSNNQFKSSEAYKVGDPLWVFNQDENILKTIRFPISIFSTFCEGHEEVKFLKDVQISCLVVPPKNVEECNSAGHLSAASYFENITLISTPTLLNRSNIPGSPNEVFIRLKPTLYKKDKLYTTKLKPVPNSKGKMCENVLKSVSLLIHHNGKEGVAQLELSIHLDDVEMGTRPFPQSYEIRYVWADNFTAIEKRSGRPGYLSGSPLVGGSLTRGDDNTPLGISVDNPKEWPSFLSPTSSGFCGKRKPLLFKQNMWSSCKLSFSKELLQSTDLCSALQKKIWDSLLAGVQMNETTPSLNMYLGSYGDPTIDVEWVPIILEDSSIYDKKSPCEEIVSGVDLKVVYSYSGSFENPQAKVIGASMKILRKKLTCSLGDTCILVLSSSVLFVDVSLHAVSRLAPPPFFRIKLPQDFFYPFSSGLNRAPSVNHLQGFILCVVAVLLLF